ncbi:hypothetical protein [Streptomyces wuyuanensis]|uniref:hypothetical protein n=1 Tax=Streptomyces wuyuanensis TaxID=1196353 RepID=UPI0037B48770
MTVRAWLADHNDEVELLSLPSCSPERNLDELVHSDLKRSLPRTTSGQELELAAETRGFFDRGQRQPDVITGYVKAPARPLRLRRMNQGASGHCVQPDDARCQVDLTPSRRAS